MRQDPPAEHVDDGGEIDEATRHRKVGDVHRPHMIGALDLFPAQEIGINLVTRRWLAGVRPAIDRLDSHALHQRRHMATADRDALALQEIAQHPAACEGVVEMQFVEPPHDLQVLGRNRPGLIVDGATANVQDLRLPGERQVVIAVNHRFALSKPALVSAPSKKSFSNVSSPILACSAFKSTAASFASLFSWPKTPAAPSRS